MGSLIQQHRHEYMIIRKNSLPLKDQSQNYYEQRTGLSPRISYRSIMTCKTNSNSLSKQRKAAGKSPLPLSIFIYPITILGWTPSWNGWRLSPPFILWHSWWRMGYELQDNAGIGLALRLFHRLGRHDSYRSIDLAIYETKGLVLKPILTIWRISSYTYKKYS